MKNSFDQILIKDSNIIIEVEIKKKNKENFHKSIY